MNSSPDLNASPKVHAWNPAELDLPNPPIEAAAAFFDLEPLSLRDHSAPALSPAQPAPADANTLEAGSAVKAWAPRELNRSPLIPLAVSGAELDLIEENAFGEIHEKFLRKARLEAEGILSAAQKKAEATIRESQENAAEIARQAREEGIAGGRAEIAGLLRLANGIVTEVQSWQEGILRQSEDLVLGLVQDITGKLFGGGFALDTERLEKVFERALAEAKSLGDLRIRAHPEDVSMLDELWPARQTAIRGQKIEMVPDQDVQRGGCYVDGQFGSVDGRVETQLMLVNQTLSSFLEAGSQTTQPLAAGMKIGHGFNGSDG